MFNSLLVAVLSALAVTSPGASAHFIRAVPASVPMPFTHPLHTRDVYAPPVLAPNSTSVWNAGETQTVVWDTSTLDEQGMNTTGYLLLGYLCPDDGSSEHLDIRHPLAHGFQLGDGSTDIVIPANLTSRDSYIIVLLGDSGDASQPFVINGVNATDASTTSSVSSAAPVPSDAL